MTDARRDAPRAVPVTAVVVTRGVTDYLPQTLAALAAQTRAPQQVLVVDAAPPPGTTGAVDLGTGQAHGGIGELLGEHWSAGPPDPSRTSVVEAHGARTFGAAVRAALEATPDAPPPPGGSPSPGAAGGWLWLLHDDSAPEPTALAELLRAVEIAPSVGIAGCKQQSWADPVRVLEVGLTTSRFGRRMTGLDEAEVDQGQHDGREDVLAVGLAGALVRRDVWDLLGGPDPALGPYGDGLDLSRRARLAGHRVVVVPTAVVRHAQASLARPTHGAALHRPGWDARRSAVARRTAYLHAQLTGVPAGAVPVVAVLAVLSGVVRALGRLVTKEPHLVLGELSAPWRVLARPARIAAARRRARATSRMPRRSLRPLQVTWRDVVRQARDRRMTAAERRRNRQAPSELELAELAALRSRRRLTLAGVLVVVSALTAWLLGGLITRVLSGGSLAGGAIPGGDATLGELWRAATSGWVSGGLGQAGPADPLLVAMLPLTALTGGTSAAAALVMLGALVLAATGAWFAAGAATRSVALRAWAALVWTAAPALLLGLGDGRLGAVLAHVALPWVGLGVARALGVARVDVVQSGLVGAQRLHADTGTEGSTPAVTPGSLHAPVVPELTGSPAELPTGGHVVAVLPGPGADRPSSVAVNEASMGEGSLAAAAGAGLALVLVTAGAPVLLPFVLLCLLGVAGLARRRRRRLVWVALPSLVVHAPMIVHAVQGWADGAWRVLVADPGLPLASRAGPVWEQLLGWPTTPPGLAGLTGVPATLLPLVATGLVVVVALVALVRGGTVSRAVRAGWLVAACGLAAAVVSARVVTAVSDGVVEGTTVLTAAWAGPGTSLCLAGLLAAALVGVSGVRTALARVSFGWRQPTAAAVAALLVAGPLLVLGAWAGQVRQATSPDGAGAQALQVSSVPVVPAVGRQMQTSPTAARVLRLRIGPEHADAELLGGDGRRLTELSRVTQVRGLSAPGAGPQVGPAVPDAAAEELALAVARLVSGSAPEVGAELAALGVGSVLVPPLTPDATQAGEPDQTGTPSGAASGLVDEVETATTPEERAAHEMLLGRLDSTPGLERVTETGSGIIWRVAPEAGAQAGSATVAWARLVSSPDEMSATTVPSADGRISTRLEPGASDRLLVLAERADPSWRATLDGRPLRSVDTGWRQAFEVGAEGGRLELVHDSPARGPWLVLMGLVLGVAGLLAIPVRRRRGGPR
ncbi:glycosyltransferase [Actinotalea sp. K2]|uniref:glycosyltransferase n=1 Tax=Actinotalea sp. K2 TaxID=2939438 RepID=UPI002017F17D|nr:glycosyltransferase [Actinotalea sp. K2]MCL3862690.1 glycosyltransferase [Actinotalea sp. K2]